MDLKQVQSAAMEAVSRVEREVGMAAERRDVEARGKVRGVVGRVEKEVRKAKRKR